jgi:hypothetical protein
MIKRVYFMSISRTIRGKRDRRSEAVRSLKPGNAGLSSDSIEAKLTKLGHSISKRHWDKLPSDFFANLDHYRHLKK